MVLEEKHEIISFIHMDVKRSKGSQDRFFLFHSMWGGRAACNLCRLSRFFGSSVSAVTHPMVSHLLSWKVFSTSLGTLFRFCNGLPAVCMFCFCSTPTVLNRRDLAGSFFFKFLNIKVAAASSSAAAASSNAAAVAAAAMAATVV